jgi:hypothetical protein
MVKWGTCPAVRCRGRRIRPTRRYAPQFTRRSLNVVAQASPGYPPSQPTTIGPVEVVLSSSAEWARKQLIVRAFHSLRLLPRLRPRMTRSMRAQAARTNLYSPPRGLGHCVIRLALAGIQILPFDGAGARRRRRNGVVRSQNRRLSVEKSRSEYGTPPQRVTQALTASHRGCEIQPFQFWPDLEWCSNVAHYPKHAEPRPRDSP